MRAAPETIAAILRGDALRWHLLAVARRFGPPDNWVAAGLVRNAVWDHGHGRTPRAPDGDVDVVWFDPDRVDPELDRRFEAELRRAAPGFAWSVKNQARMHARNGDEPYRSVADAMRHWPETATAVAARRDNGDGYEVLAPCGLDDLVALILRPAPGLAPGRREVFEARLRSKRWPLRWPRLRLAGAANSVVAGRQPAD